MNRVTAMLLIVMLSAASGTCGAEPAAKVCFDPARPCPGFKAHDLSFPLATDGVARAEERSARFFAVILETVPRCGAVEAKRQQIQALFPGNKAFSTRFECDGDAENNVNYSNVDPKRGFIAVYGGEERSTANQVLARAKSLNRFTGANLREMQVIYVSP